MPVFIEISDGIVITENYNTYDFLVFKSDRLRFRYRNGHDFPERLWTIVKCENFASSAIMFSHGYMRRENSEITAVSHEY